MKEEKGRPQYQGFSLPTPFVEEIKKHIEEDPKYRSITDFIRQSLREKMQRDDTSAIKRYSDLLKLMEDKGFKKEVSRIRKRGMPDEIGVLDNLDKEIESDMIEQQKIKQHGKKMIDLYQKQKQEYRERYAKEIDDWVLHQLQQNEDQEIKKEPAVQLSKSDLTDMIQDVVTKILGKKEKKLE